MQICIKAVGEALMKNPETNLTSASWIYSGTTKGLPELLRTGRISSRKIRVRFLVEEVETYAATVAIDSKEFAIDTERSK